MTDENPTNLPQLQQEMHRARVAREVTENPEFRSAVQAIRADLVQAWESSPARDTQGREQLWQAVQMLGKIERQLLQTIETGELAKLQLQQERSRMDQLKGWLSGRPATLV